jgi:antitoxin (DNA-binding transcriptional repressor) of toxin-antitoxin stability system
MKQRFFHQIEGQNRKLPAVSTSPCNGSHSWVEECVKRFLAQQPAKSYLGFVKTVTVQQVPEQWPDILRWVAAGEEVQMTDRDKVVAKLVPATTSQPDFVNRAKAVWGENPSGKSLSEIVAEARGGEQ